MRILVALSGGIDSSVVAHLLKEQGHDLIGVRFTLWSDPLAPAFSQILPSKCCNAQTSARTKYVADFLRIPLRILDLEEEFKKEVVDPFLDGHKKGLTPNPCIGCNRTIKFGRLLELANELGCEKLATGHYARTAMESGEKNHLLLEALDKAKDQSYYLYGLSQEQLSRVLFPLGSLYKEQVFSLAKHFKIPYEEESYRESQDLCFFPEKTPQAFLKRHLKNLLKPGKIIRRDGTVIGTHKGLPLYTIGQRKLGIGGLKIPLEVVQKNYSENELIVEEKGSEKIQEVKIKEIRWVSWSPRSNRPEPFECRTRSLSQKLHGTLWFSQASGTFTFSLPQSPQAPGQSLVLYRGEEIVGGGVII
ncbi:tRNA 2-thiouridine(34) synthase MnmA [Candidatus Peribacteria bacterium RIFCSPHIGHO2_01_FULL_51_9]|nr:MAG: tRNA 2-thiouridine(34) synthase MnmA [Candidatus Peribacteria bacterium RIFCSPHIGHO2_01_FULL_51_9]